MKMKKLDMSGIKEYLFQKGERVGLVVCGGIGFLLLALGVMKAGGSAEPYAEKYDKARKRMEVQLRAVGDGTVDTKIARVDDVSLDPKYVWDTRVDWFDFTPMTQPYDSLVDNSRRNPTIPKVQEDDKHIAIYPLRGGYFSYKLEKDKVWVHDKSAPSPDLGARGLGMRPVKSMKPARMVLVTAVYPWRDLMEEYRRQLRHATMADLLAKPEDMPRPIGLNVFRCEVKGSSKGDDKAEYTEWEPLYKYDPKEDKFEVADRLKELYREAMIDIENPVGFGKHLHRGLVTPLPELAVGHYPKTDLPGIHYDESLLKKGPRQAPRNAAKLFGGGGGPRNKQPGGMAEQDSKTMPEPWSKLPTLVDQFSGKMDYFDPAGAAVQDPLMAANQPFQVRPVAVKADEKIVIEDALVRFSDVNVEPGKTYMYCFQVRMANPNYNRAGKDLASSQLAGDKELVSDFTNTPPVTIPGEYYFYAFDQRIENNRKIPEGANTEPARTTGPFALQNTPVQIHRWLSKVNAGKDWVVGDWAIAERLLIRRGEPLGRYRVMTEVPAWDETKDAFEIGYSKTKKNHTGLPIDFLKDNPWPLLVDFEGGPRSNIMVEKTSITRDESAAQLLILTSDGKLEIRNSRDDSDTSLPYGKEREERWKNWMEAIQKLKTGGQNGPPGAQ